MPRSDTHCLRDMLVYARTVQQLVHNRTREQFDADEVLIFAIIYQLQVIGEAASKVSQAYKLTQPSVPWDRITHMRHRLVHDYFSINRDIVRDTSTTAMQPLIDTLKNLVSE